MEYGSNILKTESAYYELKNASIANGILTIRPGGSAKCTIDSDYITRATEYFRVNLITEGHTDNYEPKTRVDIHFVSNEDESIYNYTVFPTESKTGVISQDIQLKAGTYKDFTFTISSKETMRFLVWELCPEAADENIKTVIEGVEQSLPKLLYDYNTWPLHVEQDERTIALITFRLLDHTDLQGHFQLTYVASEATTLTLRFKDNETTELFAPLMYDLHAGRGSVGVPHAYLERLAGIHSLIVTAQVTNGSLAIETRGILFTIDGGYLAERMLDIGADVQDISIRQLSEDNGPDEIWIVGLEKEEALVRKRKYDLKATVGFEPVLSLGRAKAAAIEFDGAWVLRDNASRYTIKTEEFPWLFWIDINDTLWCQKGEDEGTKKSLAEGVTSVFACRGYSSTTYLDQDQGLIVAYIKSGQVYYRQYRYITSEQQVDWDFENTFEEYTDVTKVAVHRLNDYRVSFEITTPTNNYWLISDRTYVNQAIPIEHINPPITEHISAVLSSEVNLQGTAVTFTDKTAAQDTFTIEYEYPLKVLEYTDMKDLIVVTVNGKVVSKDEYDGGIKSVKFNGNQLVVTLKEAVWYNQKDFSDGIVTIKVVQSWPFRLFIDPFQDLIPTQEFTWNISAPIVERKFKLQNEIIQSPTVTSTITVKGVVEVKNKISESITVPSVVLSTLLQSKVTNVVSKETEIINSPTVSINKFKVEQVGDSPI